MNIKSIARGDYFEIPALSKSQTKMFNIRDPYGSFWIKSAFNKDKIETEMTDAMAFGQLAHACVLERETLIDMFEVRDDLGKSRVNKKWTEAQKSTIKTIVSSEELAKAKAMAEAIYQYEEYRNLLYGIKAEQPFAWDDDKWHLPCKCKPDAIRNSTEGLYGFDYKTSGMDIDSVARYIDSKRFQYDVGFCARMCAVKFKQPLKKFFFLFQSTKENEQHNIRVRCVEGAALDACIIATDATVAQIKSRLDKHMSGDPAAWLPTPEILSWEFSPWADKEIANNMEVA